MDLLKNDMAVPPAISLSYKRRSILLRSALAYSRTTRYDILNGMYTDKRIGAGGLAQR
jgi:hypothetical protein